MLKVKSLDTEIGFVRDHYLESLNYVDFDLSIVLKYNNGVNRILITFTKPIGFRILDEGNLNEFWPTCSVANGWIFEVIDGGWKNLESTRRGFLESDFKEYLITGNDECVNVFSFDFPIITKYDLK